MTASPSWRDATPSQLYTAGVIGAGALLLLCSAASVTTAYVQATRTASSANSHDGRRTSAQSQAQQRRGSTSSSSGDARRPKHGKTTDESTVQVTYPITLEMCDNAFHSGASLVNRFASESDDASDALPKIRAGALFKLIDVVAGVSARKHAELSCVTVSVDSVLLLAPIYLGDLVHLSASVNRAWGSSLEVGVRVVKEDPRSGAREYVSHAYMTFVAISGPPAAASASSTPQPPPRVRLASRQSIAPASAWQKLTSLLIGPPPSTKSPKPQLQPLLPRTPLEARRHILAGRRRAKRIANAKKGEARDGVSTEVKKRLKDEVREISRTGGTWRARAETESGTWTPGKLRIERADLLSGSAGSDMTDLPSATKTSQECQLEALELEFVVQAYVSRDPAVSVNHQQGMVEVNLSGDIPLRHPLSVVERLAQQVTDADASSGSTTAPTSASLFASKIPESGSIPLPSPSAPNTARPSLPISASTGAYSPPKTPSTRRRSIFSPLKPAQEREGDTDLDQSSTNTPIKTHTNHELTRARLSAKLSKPIKVAKTVVRTLHLVFPEHTNSVGVLFGGQLMDWMEEAALLSVRHVGRGRRWGTVSLDGLEFEEAVAVGESMTFTAVVVRTFVQSCEVYVLAEAESRNGTRRITNDALFTLAFPLDESDISSAMLASVRDGSRARLLRQVDMPPGSALATFADVAVRRRASRLEMKEMLVRIYSDPS
ncbi:thioesterase [Moesziomyces antarcticus]|uniref:Related to Cytoplasmic acetyl-CoA hydrolase 1 n=2 Tax=Pseudozyma antarctica TaxID=84753 RepID=A0A5C3FQB1_PSEA2|nr:thioesterase [Moesziomyces antarcticus]GAK65321.1 thioesterase [Moesziomyces antarcticus]SPO46326.1 related to Cytoplasmic acetyl-CoA hydrolase 1 [Moesziomyces antarcticus]